MDLRADPTVHELFDLTGKVALITGGTGHLGSAMAAALAECGARVIVSSRDAHRAKIAAGGLPRPLEVEHCGIAIDQLNESSINRGFDRAVAEAGPIDILINNGHDPTASDWSSVTAGEFNRQMANATGYFLLARKLRDHAFERGSRASIVLIGSMYGLVGSYPDAYQGVCPASPVAYHTLKGGLIQMTRHLAVYWARDGIRVNCLSPGPFPADTAPAEMVARLTQKVPMGRMGHASELKGAVAFLASDASSYITGQNLVVDGGWTAW